jgi:hypothetical protein
MEMAWRVFVAYDLVNIFICLKFNSIIGYNNHVIGVPMPILSVVGRKLALALSFTLPLSFLLPPRYHYFL